MVEGHGSCLIKRIRECVGSGVSGFRFTIQGSKCVGFRDQGLARGDQRMHVLLRALFCTEWVPCVESCV
jgi:hypothetical protein